MHPKHHSLCVVLFLAYYLLPYCQGLRKQFAPNT